MAPIEKAPPMSSRIRCGHGSRSWTLMLPLTDATSHARLKVPRLPVRADVCVAHDSSDAVTDLPNKAGEEFPNRAIFPPSACVAETLATMVVWQTGKLAPAFDRRRLLLWAGQSAWDTSFQEVL